jgi:hypothetical protein
MQHSSSMTQQTVLTYGPCSIYDTADTPRFLHDQRLSNSSTPMSANTSSLAQRPHALVIGADSAQHRTILRAQGFTFSNTSSLVEGYAHALKRLAAEDTPRPLLILLDLQTSEPHFPELTAPLLTAALAHQMQSGTIRPAWLIGLAAELTRDIAAEASIAGCHQLLPTPFTDEEALDLRILVVQPAVPPHSNAAPDTLDAIHAYQITAQRIVDIVRAAQIHVWTEDDARALLGWFTQYPVARHKLELRQPNAHMRRLLRALGGERAAHKQLVVIAEEWQTRYPLYGAILDLFLAGYERKEIVKSFVEQGLYEDSRIYVCIKELPQRLAAQLRIEQSLMDEVEEE